MPGMSVVAMTIEPSPEIVMPVTAWPDRAEPVEMLVHETPRSVVRHTSCCSAAATMIEPSSLTAHATQKLDSTVGCTSKNEKEQLPPPANSAPMIMPLRGTKSQ